MREVKKDVRTWDGDFARAAVGRVVWKRCFHSSWSVVREEAVVVIVCARLCK